MAHFIRAPKGTARQSAGIEHHPWVKLTGDVVGSATCVCCGSALTARAVVADDGSAWGVDCFKSANPAWDDRVATSRMDAKRAARAARTVRDTAAYIDRLEARFPGVVDRVRAGDRSDRAARTVARKMQEIGWLPL